MGGLTPCRVKHYFPCKPIVFQIVSYDLILNELRVISLRKPKLIGWEYCHSFFCTETWFISLQKKKLELTFRKELFASLFWSVTAETPCRKQERGKNFTTASWRAIATSRGSPWFKIPAQVFLYFITKEEIVYFSSKSDSSTSNMFFLVKQRGHFMECNWLQHF